MKIIFLGISGFPKGLAAIDKQRLLAKGLIHCGHNVYVVNSIGTHVKGEFLRKGKFEEIKYIYTSLFSYRPKIFLLRRINHITAKILELIFLLFVKQDSSIVLSRNFFHILNYKIISLLKGSKIVLLSHEHTTTKYKLFSFKFLNQYLYNKYVWKMMDAAFPISDVLEKEIKALNQSLPTLRIPAITDIAFIDSVEPKKGNYFLYCGAASYIEIVEFCIKAFEQLDDNETFLYLVVSGNQENVKKIENRIAKSIKSKKIQRFSYLSYSDLIGYYKGAKGLLIPLRDTVQDTARFPHKVAEYCASGVPIISTQIGEVSNYFKHEESAYLALEYDTKQYAKLMYSVLENHNNENITANAKIVCRNNFDYKEYGTQISVFLENLK